MDASFGQLALIRQMIKYANQTGFDGYKGLNVTELDKAMHLLENTMLHNSAYLAPKWVLIVVGAIAAVAVGVLVYILRDEYRQSQLRKKGYTTVQQANA